MTERVSRLLEEKSGENTWEQKHLHTMWSEEGHAGLDSFQVAVLSWGRPTGVVYIPSWVVWVLEPDILIGSQRSRGPRSANKAACISPCPEAAEKETVSNSQPSSSSLDGKTTEF